MKNQIIINFPIIIYYFIISSLLIYYFNKKTNNKFKKAILIILIIPSTINIGFIINDTPIINDPNLTWDEQFGGKSYFPTINGTSLHIRCFTSNRNNNVQLQGDITVLFEAGTPFYSTVWGNVLESITDSDLSQGQNILKQYCVYDRYGYGWSDINSNNGRTDYNGDGIDGDGITVVNQLKQYLSIIGINDNLLLVGWSYGGILSQLFAQQFPNMVKGVVLVDSMIIDDLNDQYLIESIGKGITSFNILKYLLPTGITRFLTSFYPIQSGYFDNSNNSSQSFSSNLNPILKSSTDSIYLTFPNLFASSNELSNIMYTINQLNQIINNHSNQYQNLKYLNNIPLIVLTATDNGTPDWLVYQQNITNFSYNSKQVFASKSNHFVPLEDPNSIISSIYYCINLISYK